MIEIVEKSQKAHAVRTAAQVKADTIRRSQSNKVCFYYEFTYCVLYVVYERVCAVFFLWQVYLSVVWFLFSSRSLTLALSVSLLYIRYA